jgi:hypothetical protein
MALATRPFRNLAPTDTIPGFCVPEMFSRQLLSAGPLAPLHPAPWEGWVINADPVFDGRGSAGRCAFPDTGSPCDCACGCGWGNLGCGWMCNTRNRAPDGAEAG